ncbi:MAG: phosphate ABC transporter permease PstA [Tissierellia bacterium]|nr:phosphate ABC transporter permease PstA [Tissierellia bacterium]
MNSKQKFNSILLKVLIGIATVFTFALLIGIIVYVLVLGIPYLKPSLFAFKHNTTNMSMLPSIINTLIMILITLIIAVPIGVFSAIYMVEYAKPGNKFIKYVRLATETLQGIPSIVYGLFGYIFFVGVMKLGHSIVSGALTMSIMVLPLIIRSTEEALLAVDNKYREASYGLGARKLRTVFNVVLPPAMNGIIAGIILAIGRVFGETAALMYTSGMSAKLVKSFTQPGSTLAIHMFDLYSEGLHQNEAFATASVLLAFVVLINAISTYIGKQIGGNNGR